ncbi:unnamed protein product [Cyprideis torosa]|uniref:Uncharacterized protein n=1 Tax=Cyprideis torosa TaxID=163714 RepID=A0A7R8WEN9_9CRUS|nr:unnamed protein product [Cyprideis torosa]CAG0895979.1 unnamed protein product [Cyprideis torosa]
MVIFPIVAVFLQLASTSVVEKVNPGDGHPQDARMQHEDMLPESHSTQKHSTYLCDIEGRDMCLTAGADPLFCRDTFCCNNQDDMCVKECLNEGVGVKGCFHECCLDPTAPEEVVSFICDSECEHNCDRDPATSSVQCRDHCCCSGHCIEECLDGNNPEELTPLNKLTSGPADLDFLSEGFIVRVLGENATVNGAVATLGHVPWLIPGMSTVLPHQPPMGTRLKNRELPSFSALPMPPTALCGAEAYKFCEDAFPNMVFHITVQSSASIRFSLRNQAQLKSEDASGHPPYFFYSPSIHAHGPRAIGRKERIKERIAVFDGPIAGVSEEGDEDEESASDEYEFMPNMYKLLWIISNTCYPATLVAGLVFISFLDQSKSEDPMDRFNTFNIHGINILFVLVIVCVEGKPLRFQHFYCVILYGVGYMIFAITFFFVGEVVRKDVGAEKKLRKNDYAPSFVSVARLVDFV